jgi:L-lactate dehydrogenase complex protein LldF
MTGGAVFDGDAGLDARLDAALARPQLAETLEAVRRTVRDAQLGVRARYPDWNERVARARRIRLDGVRRMDELLDRFEGRLRANGGTLVRARTADDATRAVLEIARRRGATLAAKGKSMVSEEIGLNEALEQAGVRPVETDLGEWVCQLAGQRPSHLLAPIVHMDRGEVSDVLSAEAGELIGDDPAVMVAWARSRLRATFLDAGIGITGANFLVAETGTVVVLENEGNGRLVSSLPRCHVVVVGVEKIVERLADAAFLVEQLSLAAIARELPSYVSWVAGPARDGDDGPEELVVVVVDAGRKALVGTPYEDVLSCIRCGSCLNACPVYAKVGGHAYGSVYSGPIGAVLSPLLTRMQPGQGRKLPSLSSLCGACTEACPVGIPLHDLLVRDRAAAVAAGEASTAERAAWRAWSLAWSSPRRYRASARAASLGRVLARVMPAAAAWQRSHDSLPEVDARPFHARWSELERDDP